MHVPTSALKLGDVIEDALEYGVVTSISKNTRGIQETAVLYSNRAASFWSHTPESGSVLHSRVGEGCDANQEALKKFVNGLRARASGDKERIGFGVVCEVEASSEEIAEAESCTLPPQTYGNGQAVSMTVR
jgi:hypothetical protein